MLYSHKTIVMMCFVTLKPLRMAIDSTSSVKFWGWWRL